MKAVLRTSFWIIVVLAIIIVFGITCQKVIQREKVQKQDDFALYKPIITYSCYGYINEGTPHEKSGFWVNIVPDTIDIGGKPCVISTIFIPDRVPNSGTTMRANERPDKIWWSFSIRGEIDQHDKETYVVYHMERVVDFARE